MGARRAVAVTYAATGGTMSTSGLYKAGTTAGTYPGHRGAAGRHQADTASVTITAPAPTLSSVVVTPATVSLAARATQQFTAVGKMSDGSTTAVTVTWSATGGTVSTSGLYKAGTTAGTYRVIAVQQGGTKADTSAITVTATTAPARPGPGQRDGGSDVVAGGDDAGEERGGLCGAQRAGDGGGRVLQ